MLLLPWSQRGRVGGRASVFTPSPRRLLQLPEGQKIKDKPVKRGRFGVPNLIRQYLRVPKPNLLLKHQTNGAPELFTQLTDSFCLTCKQQEG